MKSEFDVNDLLEVPQVFAIKELGLIKIEYGLGADVRSVMMAYLMIKHKIVTCGQDECDCTDKAFEANAKNCVVVPVEVREVKT